jgi:hypothetical protein
MPAGRTYEPIATYTLTSNTTTVVLNSIPTTYSDLEVVINPASSSGTNGIRMRINNDSATNYSINYLSGNGTSAQANRENSAVNMSLNGYFGISTSLNTQIYKLIINGYSNTNINKTVLARISGANGGTELNSGVWRSNSAITSLSFNINTFGSSTGDFITGTTFTLYGIAAA